MKRKRLHVLGLTIVFTTFFYRHFSVNRNEIIHVKPTIQTNTKDVSVASFNHVTKSMAELGKMDEVNKYFLFLNHVPKSGSEVLIVLLQHLQGVNSFKHVRLKGGIRKVLANFQQVSTDVLFYRICRSKLIQ